MIWGSSRNFYNLAAKTNSYSEVSPTHLLAVVFYYLVGSVSVIFKYFKQLYLGRRVRS